MLHFAFFFKFLQLFFLFYFCAFCVFTQQAADILQSILSGGDEMEMPEDREMEEDGDEQQQVKMEADEADSNGFVEGEGIHVQLPPVSCIERDSYLAIAQRDVAVVEYLCQEIDSDQ